MVLLERSCSPVSIASRTALIGRCSLVNYVTPPGRSSFHKVAPVIGSAKYSRPELDRCRTYVLFPSIEVAFQYPLPQLSAQGCQLFERLLEDLLPHGISCRGISEILFARDRYVSTYFPPDVSRGLTTDAPAKISESVEGSTSVSRWATLPICPGAFFSFVCAYEFSLNLVDSLYRPSLISPFCSGTSFEFCLY